MKDLKYLVAYIAPILVFVGLSFGDIVSYSAFAFAFVLVPMCDAILPQSKENLSEVEVKNKRSNRIFDILLYINLPLVYGAIIYFLYGLIRHDYSTAELLGHILSLGTVMGASGINVAHELGHRNNKAEQLMAQVLLLPSFYMHFFIEHNLGHHRHVATPEDPSTARFNENIYMFWIRSTYQSYISAWKIESLQLKRDGNLFWSIHNRMIHFALLQFVYLIVVFLFASWEGVFVMLSIGIISFLLLETINYIEHYGLVRAKRKNGNYEPVQPKHSWNSNHEFGRLVLYELTRHSDHHFRSSKKYQTLDHHEDALQLPYGYPASMLLSLVPPLWFKTMNKKVVHHE